MPKCDNAPQAHSRVSNINFEFGFGGGAIQIPWIITEGRQSSLPLGVYVKGIARDCNWLKCLGGIMHLKPTAECQISTLIFGFRGRPYRYPMKFTEERQSSLPLAVYVKDIAGAFNWLKCLGGIMHLKPTGGCQISTLIFGFRRRACRYPMKNYRRTAKFFATWGLCQRYCPGL
jgi:hypothetical protein